jgi:hypothetical protein
MNDEATIQNNTKTLRYLVILLVIVFVVYGGISIYNKSQQHNTKPEEFITWIGVPAVLDSAVKLQSYIDGGVYLSNPGKLKNANSMQRDVYSVRLTIDFLRSLTPEQISYFKNKKALPFDKLSKNQQTALMRIRTSRVEGGEVLSSSETAKSCLWMQSFKLRYYFSWMIPINKNKGSVLFDMELTLDGYARFIHPYRKL